MRSIAFIGTGIMGAAMAGHLMDAGYALYVYNRTKEKAQGLLDRGAVWKDSPADCVREADAAITIVGYPRTWKRPISGKTASLPVRSPVRS